MYALLLPLLLLAPPDTAAVEADLPEISVVAARLAAAPSEAPVRVTVLGRHAIDASGSRTVADLLEARSSAHVRRHGPAGLASISLRGTGASQTLVLLDGHRIADPQLGQLDLSLLPTILLDRVEVMHGAGSAVHGSDGIGGVVDLRTLRPEASGVELATRAGAFGEAGATGRAAIGGGGVRAVVAGELSRLEGDFPFTHPQTGAETRRAGGDATLGSVFGRVEANAGRSTFSGAVWAGTADRGVPGSVGAPLSARQTDQHVRVWGSAISGFGWGSVRAGGILQYATLRYQGDESRTALASGEVEARLARGPWVAATGVTLGTATAAHPQLAEGSREGSVGAFVSAIGDYGRLLVYPAIRADLFLRGDGAHDHLAAVSPRLGANWQPAATLPVRLKAGAGSAFRAPTFNDRFWRYAGTDLGGHPDLRPERGWTADGGVFAEAGPIRVEATLYATWLRDQIVWRPGLGGLFVPVNVGRTRTWGAELSAETAALAAGPIAFSGGTTWSLTDARDRSDPDSPSYGRQLRYVPRHQVKSHVTASTGLGSETDLALDLSGVFVSSRPVRVDGTLDEPSYFVMDARMRMSHAIGSTRVAVSIGIENVLDADYSILRGYPMPPRHARVQLHFTF